MHGDTGFLRHSSPEGGRDTVGYGHKLTQKNEVENNIYGIDLDDLTIEDAERILTVDVGKCSRTLSRALQRKFGIGIEDLSNRKQMMLLDFEYNLGSAVKVFPSFTGAVIAGDRTRQEAEYKRSFVDRAGVRQPLARNAAFYSTFMTYEAIGLLGE